MTLSDLFGTWRLLSFETLASDGTSGQPSGSAPLRVQADDSAAMQDGVDDEVRTAHTCYVAYFGTHEVNETQGYLAHNVDVSLFPNWQSVPRQRFFDLSGSILALTPPQPFGGREVTGVRVWERAS